jgi:hypothetical protein
MCSTKSLSEYERRYAMSQSEAPGEEAQELKRS